MVAPSPLAELRAPLGAHHMAGSSLLSNDAANMQDLITALESSHVRRLHLNPVTAAATASCLTGIAAAESRELSPAEAKQLAAASAGDLRTAIGTLQMLLCGTAPVPKAKGRKVGMH
jgi:hypothetical protein